MVNDSFFLNAEDRTITMVKGDTMAFNFQVQGLEGSPDAIAFTCKEHYDDATPLFTSVIYPLPQARDHTFERIRQRAS